MGTFSDIDVCRNACVILGLEPISNFNDGTPAGSVMGVRYPLFREVILTDHIWNFAVKKVRLTREADVPVSQWKYQYLLPSDGLADGVIAAYESDDEGAHSISDFVIQNGRLLTNYESIYVDYLADIDESYWPSYFVDYAAHALAADVCLTLTRDRGLKDELDEKIGGLPSDGGMGGLFARARRKDSYHAPANNKFRKFPLLMVRRGSRIWGRSL